MHPVLFDLGPVQIRTYGVLLSVAFLLGVWLAAKRGRDRGIDTPLIYDLTIVIILSAIAGSRAYYVFVNREFYEGNLLSALKVWEGGLSMYGGVILAIAASFVFSRQKKVRFNKIADVIAPSLAVGLMVTRVGCFFNGCCFGKTTAVFTGMVFPSNSEAGRILFGETIHPTQLYASLYGTYYIPDPYRGRPEVSSGWVSLCPVSNFILGFEIRHRFFQVLRPLVNLPPPRDQPQL